MTVEEVKSIPSSAVEEVVVIQYEQLTDPSSDVSDLIEKAFGPNGIGILAVRGVPTFPEKRRALLPLSRQCVRTLFSSSNQLGSPCYPTK